MAARTDGTFEARTAERRPTMAPSTLRSRDRAATDVTVIDLSQTGIRIATEAELGVGEEISIGLSGVGARRAYVAWRREGEYGCAFDLPLGPKEMTDAFTSVSVIRLGTAEELTAATGTAGKAELIDLYGQHSLWRMPADAMLVVTLYVAALGWAIWHFLLAH